MRQTPPSAPRRPAGKRPGPKTMTAMAFAAGLALAVAGAGAIATGLESRSRAAVAEALAAAGQDWAEVRSDGLQVMLAGTAPSEAQRFRAQTIAASIVDAGRIVDLMEVELSRAVAPPAFSLEILRNDDGISLIGLLPAATDRDALAAELGRMAGEGGVTDMLESADYPLPEGWEPALDFAISALRTLPRSKISVAAGTVSITALADSPTEKTRIQTELSRRTPTGVALVMDISAPRPVITPFTLRFLVDAEGGARFDACSADTDRARERIVEAARAAGVEGTPGCTVGMGVPSTAWAEAVTQGMAALAELGEGSLTFSDADVALIAGPGVTQAAFDRVVGELESHLPAAFSLKAERTPSPDAEAEGPPEFSATLSPAGQVQLRGRLPDALTRDAVENFARARFGNPSVYGATRLDDSLPAGWPLRALAGIEVLAELDSGAVMVQPDLVRVRGVTGNEQGSDAVARILTARLGEGANFDLNVRYDRRLDPLLGLPTGAECVSRINEALTLAKIGFEPGSAVISGPTAVTLDAVAGLMENCTDFRIEIAGHTDSQGRDVMNLRLSQERAQAVIQALRDRRVLTGNLVPQGYGSEQPIADNRTEAGREANRRIEFVLLDANPQSGLEEETAAEGAPAAVGVEPDGTQPQPAESPTGLVVLDDEGVAAAPAEATDAVRAALTRPGDDGAAEADTGSEAADAAPEAEEEATSEAAAETGTGGTEETPAAAEGTQAADDPAVADVAVVVVVETPDAETPRPVSRPDTLTAP